MAGMKVVYAPSASVVHGHERSLWGDFTFAVDNGITLARAGILNNPEIDSEFGYGLGKIRRDLAHFRSERMYGYMLRYFVTAVARGVGVQLGKRENRLPRWFMRRISWVTPWG